MSAPLPSFSAGRCRRGGDEARSANIAGQTDERLEEGTQRPLGPGIVPTEEKYEGRRL